MAENDNKEEVVEETKNDTEEEKKKKIVFWVRVVLFVLFGVVCPVAFITWRFKLFRPTESSGIAIGGYGILAITIVAIFAVIILKYLARALTDKSPYVSHLIRASLRLIIPLAALLWMIYSLRNSMDLFIQVLGVCLVSFIIAVLVNPFPEFIAEKKKQAKLKENEDLADYIIKKIKKKDSEDK